MEKKNALNFLKKTALSYAPQAKKMASAYGSQLASAAKAGLNARVARTANGFQTKIAGAPPTPTPASIQNAKPVAPPGTFL